MARKRKHNGAMLVYRHDLSKIVEVDEVPSSPFILIHRGNVEPVIMSSSIKLGVYPVILPDRAHT